LLHEDAALRQKTESFGVRSVLAAQLLAALRPILSSSEVHVSVADFDWDAWGRVHPSFARSPQYAPLQTMSGAQVEGANDSRDMIDLRRALSSLSAEERPRLLIPHLKKAVAEVIGASEEIDASVSLRSLGLDSLMASELRVRVERLGLDLPIVSLIRGPSINDLAESLAERSLEEQR
jgi:aryl carrier-like protein